jgi:hypothetical protein
MLNIQSFNFEYFFKSIAVLNDEEKDLQGISAVRTALVSENN